MMLEDMKHFDICIDSEKVEKEYQKCNWLAQVCLKKAFKTVHMYWFFWFGDNISVITTRGVPKVSGLIYKET